MTIVKLPARTSELWDSLMEFNGAASLSIPWADAVRIGTARGSVGEVVLGEVTSAEDWKLVPPGRNLRVLMLRKGDKFCLRWGDHRMREVVSGPYHDHLLSRFEVEEFDLTKKSGFLEVFPDKLEVKN